MKKSAGFTLIELLIALGLMAIFALLAYRGLDSVLRLNGASQQHDAQAAARLRVITQLEADIRQAQRVSITAPASGEQTLQLKRRTSQTEGEARVVDVVWSLNAGTLTRQADEQSAALLAQVTQVQWLVHSSTPTPSSAPWQPIAAQAGAASELPVRRAVALRFTQNNQTYEKAFLIGK